MRHSRLIRPSEELEAPGPETGVSRAPVAYRRNLDLTGLSDAEADEVAQFVAGLIDRRENPAPIVAGLSAKILPAGRWGAGEDETLEILTDGARLAEIKIVALGEAAHLPSRSWGWCHRRALGAVKDAINAGGSL